MFPERWYAERREYERQRLEDRERQIKVALEGTASGGGDRVTDALGNASGSVAVDAPSIETLTAAFDPSAGFDAQPLSAADLAELATIGRGKYRAGDTRGFAAHHEQECEQCNCWMVRAPDGTPRYWSQPRAS